MLYDPKWEKPAADVFSLAGLIAWLEKQPADTEYDYCAGSTCLTAQYLKAMGVDDYSLDTAQLERLGWKHIAQNINRDDSGDKGWTFGAALARAKGIGTDD